MTDPFLGEIKIFAGNFAPRDYAFCDGRSVPVDQNPALFSIISTLYGGDGRTTFDLPDLQGRAPLHYGGSQGPGLSPYRLAEKLGTDTVTLTDANMPPHNHNAQASELAGDQMSPTNNVISRGPTRMDDLFAPAGNTGTFNALANTGGGGGRSNLQPLLVINFIIALNGIFPSRN